MPLGPLLDLRSWLRIYVICPYSAASGMRIPLLPARHIVLILVVPLVVPSRACRSSGLVSTYLFREESRI